jgi:hypothetical protein
VDLGKCAGAAKGQQRQGKESWIHPKRLVL